MTKEQKAILVQICRENLAYNQNLIDNCDCLYKEDKEALKKENQAYEAFINENTEE